MLIENVVTVMKQWCLDKVLDVARGKMEYETLPKQRKAVEAFISVFVCLPAGYRPSFFHDYLPSQLTICTGQYSPLTGYSASSPHAKHRTDIAP